MLLSSMIFTILSFRGILIECESILKEFIYCFFFEYSSFSSSLIVDKSFYFIELGSLSFRVIFAGLKYQHDHRCHGDVTNFSFVFIRLSHHDI